MSGRHHRVTIGLEELGLAVAGGPGRRGAGPVDTDSALAIPEIGLEDVTLVGAGLDLTQDVVPLPLEGLIATVQTVELEAERGVRDPRIGPLDHHLLDLGAGLGRLGRSCAEEVFLVLELQLREPDLEHLELFVGSGRFHHPQRDRAAFEMT